MKKAILLSAMLLSSGAAMAQWSGDRDIATPIFPECKSLYWDEVCVGADGTIWFFCDNPASTDMEDIHTTVYSMRLQAISPDGTRLFGDNGLVLSEYDNRSWTVCNQLLYANQDSTVTVVVHDSRNSSDDERNMNYTAYRLRADGSHVWDEDGVPVDNAMVVGSNAAMSITEIEDGSNIFAWLWMDSKTTNVSMQKITKDGTAEWDPMETKLSGSYNDYPYLVRSTENRFILIWGRSSSEYLTAMGYNADGTQSWEKRVTLYTGGFGSVPAWTKIKVKPAGDGGAIATWFDDRDGTIEYPYIAYVKADGKLGFVNAEGNADIRLGYEEWRHINVDAIPDGQGTGYLAIFNQCSVGQSYYNACVQHVSLEGDLDYGENGVALMPIDDTPKSVSFLSVQPGPNGTFAAFWLEFHESYWDIQAHMSIRRISDGEPVSEDTRDIRFVEGGRYRTGLCSYVDMENECWYAYWKDQGGTPEEKVNWNCLQRISFDGSLPAVESLGGIMVQQGTSYYDMQGHALSQEPASGIFIKRQNGRSNVVVK